MASDSPTAVRGKHSRPASVAEHARAGGVAPEPAIPEHPFRHALLAWFREHQRSLPWRTEASLYRTVVSEFMLQQTQVKTVLPYFNRWMRTFPDFATLAAASEEAVARHWEGLGYYSRARNLHRLARALVSLPAVPTDAVSWRELPGIGPYTAAAITSIAFGAREACVDGNVVRILARLTADATPFRDSASAARSLTPLADRLLSPESPGDHNQAMMELGATVCHRRRPLCLTCPVRPWCAAVRTGSPEDFPRLQPKVIEQVAVTRVWAFDNRGLLLHRINPGARRLAGVHELPTPGHLGLEERAVTGGTLLVRKKRGITRYAITESIYALDPVPEMPKHPELVWVPLSEIDRITLSGPHRRWVTELLDARNLG